MHRKRPVLGVACAAASGEAPTTTTEGTSTLHDGKTVLPLRVGVRIDPKRLAGWPHELDRRYVKSSNIMALIYIGLTMMPLLDAGGDCDDNYEKMIITVVMTMMMMTMMMMMMMMMTMTTKMRNMLSMMAAMLMIMVLMTWTAMFTMTTASDYDYGATRCV